MDEQSHVDVITLQLLDSALGHAIQAWQFQGESLITIGRHEDNSIVLSDPQVSRRHVELQCADTRWTLNSVGRNGTRIDGQVVTNRELWDGCIFQLGTTGPSFKILTRTNSDSPSATVDFEVEDDEFSFLQIDQEQKAKEVQKIMDDETFLELRFQLEKLKGKQDQ